MLNYWNIKQVHQLVQDVFNIPISSPLFYRYCAKNLKKDEKLDVGVSQKRDTKKEEIATLDEDELGAVAMFSSKKN